DDVADLSNLKRECGSRVYLVNAELTREVADVAAVGRARVLGILPRGLGEVDFAGQQVLAQGLQPGPRRLALALRSVRRNADDDVAGPHSHAIEEVSIVVIVFSDIGLCEAIMHIALPLQ